MSAKDKWISEAVNHIEKCDHFAVKALAKSINTEPDDSDEFTEHDMDILMLGRIAERINLQNGSTKETMAKIKELKAKKNANK